MMERKLRSDINLDGLLADRFQKGLSTKQLAAAHGVSVRTIQQRLADAKGDPKYNDIVNNINTKVSEAGPAKPEVKDKDLLLTDSYVYNKDTDTYVTFLDVAPKPVVVAGEKHRAMCRAYSNWDGQAASIDEMCRTFSFPRHWLNEYKQKHGWTHDKEPFTKEELSSRNEEDLVEDLLTMKKESVYRKFETKKWTDIKANANKWMEVESSILAPLVEHIKKNAAKYQPPKLEFEPNDKPFAIVLSPADLHYGKNAWRDETGEPYSRSEAKELLLVHTKVLVDRVNKFGKPDKIYIAVGNDWFHVDNPRSSTTAGTHQDTDGVPSQILIEGCELAVEHIDMLRQVAPVEIYMSSGNHDEESSLAVLLYVRAWFRQCSDVKVTVSPASRQYTEYGNTLIGFTHGDAVKPTSLGPLMATEAREAWGRTTNRAFYTGHLHHEVTRDIDGITHYQLPSLSAADRWHSRKGYVTSRRALTAYVIDKADGVIATLVSPVKKELAFGVKMPLKSLVSQE
jgi:hypothetical protein